MRKILVPTDFSECSYYAAEVAAQIAKKTGARLYMLHVMDIPVYERNDTFQTYSDAAEGIFWMKLVKKRFKELFAKPFMQGVNAVEVLQFDGVYQTITSQASEHEIDLIVMGSHGDNGAHELFIGSNTEKVVRTAHCPVLTIKNRHEKFEPKNVLFASNFYGEAKDNFEPLNNFIKLYNPKVHLAKVNTPTHFETTSYSNQLIQNFLATWKLPSYEIHIHNERTVPAGVAAVSQQTEADLIIIETHGKNGIERFFRGSDSESVVNHSKRPVLSMKIKPVAEDL